MEPPQPLADAVDATGARLVWWRPSQIHHPTHVQYRVGLERRGRRREETFVSDHAAAWPWHLDPELPGLRRALAWPGTEVRARSYRPGRRAVVEVRGPDARLFLKVVRPGRAGALHDAHLAASLAIAAVPRPLDATDDGIVVLAAREGVPYRSALRRPPPAALHALLDRLPLVSGARRDPFVAARHHAATIAAVLPEAAPLVGAILVELPDKAAADGPEVAVHGDFHPGQLLVSGGEVTGLLDVDTLRPGQRVDDVATMLAHLLVAPVGRDAQALEEDACRRFGAHEFAPRVAAALVGLATGPYRRVEPDWGARTVDILSRAMSAIALQHAGAARAGRLSPP